VINGYIFRALPRRCQLELLLSNLPFYFRVRIGPEALQLAAAVILYFPGLMQARRLRLNHRHRQLSTRCTGNQEQTIRCWRDGSVFAGLSQADSSLESLAAIQGREKKHCYFLVRRSAAWARNRPGDSLLTLLVPGIWSYSCGQPFDLFFPGLWTRWSHWSCWYFLIR